MQGIFINHNRPKSKKEIKESNPSTVSLEATSLFGNEYGGPITDAPDGTYTFVGPDPYNSRKFYGTIKKAGDSIKIT
jgi:hypothetical protein